MHLVVEINEHLRPKPNRFGDPRVKVGLDNVDMIVAIESLVKPMLDCWRFVICLDVRIIQYSSIIIMSHTPHPTPDSSKIISDRVEQFLILLTNCINHSFSIEDNKQRQQQQTLSLNVDQVSSYHQQQ